MSKQKSNPKKEVESAMQSALDALSKAAGAYIDSAIKHVLVAG
jgi:hypothetical protein